MKRINALFGFALMLCMVLSSCGGHSSKTTPTGNSSNSTPSLVSITITGAGSATSLPVGGTLQLTAQGKYSDGSTSDLTSQVTWALSDGSMASLSTSGLLTGKKTGSVIAIATKGAVSGTLLLSVSKAAITSIAVSGGGSLAAGFTEQLAAQGTFTDNSTQSVTAQATWQTSDATIATVSGAGVLTALKAGTVVVTASIGTVSGTLSVVVNPALSTLIISPASFSIASGQKQQLTAQGVYSDGTSHDVTTQVTWTSNNGGVASVSGGLVTGVSTGSATITATLGSVSKTASATVTAASLQSINVSPATSSVATGQSQAFTAYGLFSDGSTTDITNSVTWSSNAANVATVNPTGLATGVGTGSATITATSGTASGSATLSVTSAILTSVDISPDDQTIPIGGQIQLTLTGSYSDNTTQDITIGATWTSSDPTLASVDPVSGIVTGVKNSNGNPVTITASYGAFSGTTTVTVTDAVPESLTLTPATASIAAGTTQQYTVNQIYSDGSIQPVVSGLSWISSSAATASVDANGLATGIAPGQATITVAYGSMTATASLTVTSATLTALVVTPVTTVVGINGTVQFTATGVFSDNSVEDLTSQAAWSSSVASYAVINDAGVASGLSAGTTTITATYGGVSGTATLNVTTATLVSITVLPANPIAPPRSRIQMTAIGVFSDGTQVQLTGVSWRTNSARYAMVSSTGVLRTKKTTNQPVVVYARLNGITGQTNITISNMTIASVQLTPATPTIAVGTTQQFALIGTFSDGVTTVDLTPSARWQTSNYAEAVIDRSGIASGLAAGTVTITATYKGLSPTTATLIVSNATIQSINVTPASPTVALGGLQQFAATGLFSDGSTQDITSVSQWTSSTPTVAVIKQTGLASSASHGQTTINATFKGVTGSTTLNVN